ncbi:probable E3 ubiquitin-protein ligase sinah [Leptidea sinapis]|uniref:probable E3 ubiquitin-protein ligase sinah n=1 Tax=Leptidea sinapis TaxID=189913 RepID=UPI002135DA61|nr:probable E3 ubiquitin-protein ligase sinah [Leptidea sinapis]XP_050670827.1 probable E3 ubiquitin-protein ligase sinah [Leptidea sinapis]XP_050670828.1 probable E3 ubiquitin-protein ligase sinah [Leptidea sinapis]XP_050670829.1 probable E3 ubiquitin-protein ligase sinah [Leptidea sinapis]
MAAAAKQNRAKQNALVPECPVCLNAMTVPIYQCTTGHSLCNGCTQKLSPPNCPICRQLITHMRNWALEEMIEKVATCPNKAEGCTYVVANENIENHLKECMFRDIYCPLRKLNTCSWKGKFHIKSKFNIVEHCKQKHPENIKENANSEFNLNHVSINAHLKQIFVMSMNKRVFIVSFDINPVNKMAFWAVQLIGTKKQAVDCTYEIQLTSMQTEKRMVTFKDHCFNDTMDDSEIYGLAKCPVMPLDMLSHFMKDNKLCFRCELKLSTYQKTKNDGPNRNQKPNKDAANERQFAKPHNSAGKNAYKNNMNKN